MNRARKGLLGKDVLISSLLAATLIMFYNKIFSLGENFDTFETISFVKKEPNIKYGFDLNEVKFETKKVQKGETLVSILESYGIEEDKEVIPNPSHIIDINHTKNQAIVIIKANMRATRDEMNNKSVKKTLTIPKWLNDEAMNRKINFSAILKEALKDELEIR